MPPLSGTCRARGSISAAPEMMPRWSRSHCTADSVTAELVAHRREQPALAADEFLPGVQQQEVAGAVGVLGLAGREADLADHGGLLVAEVAGERDSPEGVQAGELAVAAWLRGRLDPWQHLPRDAEEAEQF